ncbi:MAG: signal recognition particle-docking protein FtsY [Clostridiales bacterium]|nr:signal recognition particle-docking protein FtsY [Clostridiales bacterium]
MGFFKKIGQALKKTKEAWTRKIDALLSKGEIDDELFDDLTDILISCDIGVKASLEIVEDLRTECHKKKIRTAEGVKQQLKENLESYFEDAPQIEIDYPAIITIIGVNGVGKTTTIGKMANYFKENKKSVTLVAGDTFRAAASSQLNEWAGRTKTRIIKHAEGADAAAVVYDGIASAKANKTEVLIVDTAGRLHTKTNLMEELKKIERIVDREYPEAHKYNFIVLDATTGQNALSQINAFAEYVQIDGIVLTKLDGTAKGGVVIAIEKEYKLPVAFVGTGEGINDLEFFDAKEFVESLF